LIILPETLRFVGLPSNIGANIRQIIYGLALLIMMYGFNKESLLNRHIEKS
jgi:branched-chain amino acid transport system permease protein